MPVVKGKHFSYSKMGRKAAAKAKKKNKKIKPIVPGKRIKKKGKPVTPRRTINPSLPSKITREQRTAESIKKRLSR